VQPGQEDGRVSRLQPLKEVTAVATKCGHASLSITAVYHHCPRRQPFVAAFHTKHRFNSSNAYVKYSSSASLNDLSFINEIARMMASGNQTLNI